MAEVKFYFRNCACCSGSGSSGSSGSGSGSAGGCECQFWASTPCAGESYDSCDSIQLKATVTFSYESCGQFYGGSFWKCSGSSASGAETGLEPPEGSGSGSGSCLQECPDCCDLLPKSLTFNLVCVGGSYVSENLIDANPDDPAWAPDSSCVGLRSDKEAYMVFPSCIFGSSDNCQGILVVPLDGFYLIFYLYSDPSYGYVNSCNPIDIRYSITCGNPTTSAGLQLMPCFQQCIGDNICCVRANIVITEALAEGGGGGGPIL